MPRFVSKEDVQKGLVDPTKPLKDQPEYKKKLDQETKNREPKQYQNKEPIKTKKEKDLQNKNPQQNEEKKEQRKPKKQRDNRPEYNWNKKQITLESVVPEFPKKILPKPDQVKFDETIKKLKDQRQSLYGLRKKLIEEQNFIIKSNSDTKKGGFNALSKFSGQLKQNNNLKNIIDGKIKKLEEQRRQVEEQIKSLKEINGNLFKPKGVENYTTERLKQTIQQLEQRLSSENLDKKQEATINNNINVAKRALLKSKPQIQIKTEFSKNDDNMKILYDQLKALKKQIDASYNQIRPIKQQIRVLLQKRKEEEGTITEVRSFQQIKAEYDQKIKANDAKREQINKKMDQNYENNYKQNDAYQDQQDLIRYIKYVQEQKQFKKKRFEEQQKRKKQRQEQEKKKQKEFQDRQKKREQRKKQDEERNKRQEEKRERLQRQRQEFINKNPNYFKIDMCNFMITYCQNLRPDTKTQTQQERKAKVQDMNLAKQKGWEKQAKSGCALIIGKKEKQDEQVKKVKKEKKKKQTEDDGSLNHNIDTINRFHDLNILPPSNINKLDQTIRQLNDKIQIYNKPSQEEVNAYKAKAEIEFDRIHGLTYRVEHKEKEDEEQKPLKNDKKRQKAERIQLKGSDFPELN